MAAPEQYDPHYLRDVTALGDTHDIHTSQAIFSRNRIKLVEKGVRLDSHLYERLMQHKLLPPIEECITVEGAVTGGELKAKAAALLDSDAGYALLKDAKARPAELLLALEGAPLDSPLAVRLTVMRERRQEMFRHSLSVALLTVYLGRRAGRVSGELAQWAGAGLYHDLGEMHIDSELLGAKRSLTAGERRQMRAHPLTAYLILQMRASCSEELADAVFEHHERLDGSGYPRGIRGDELGDAGRALAIAELAATFFSPPRGAGALSRLPVVLQLNHRRFDRAFTNHIIVLARQAKPSDAAGGATPDAAIERLRAIQAVFRDWQAFAPAGAATAGGENAAYYWVAERMGQLERSLLEAGLDMSQDPELAASLAEDAAGRAELPAAARELTWLLVEIVQGLYARLGESRNVPLAAWAEKVDAALGQGRADA